MYCPRCGIETSIAFYKDELEKFKEEMIEEMEEEINNKALPKSRAKLT